MSDFIQTKLAGRYEVRERIGAGGMARVFKARDTNLDRWVAVKILHEHLVEDPSFKERFEREAKLVASLNHPSIVQVYDYNYFERDGLPVCFMVMPFIPGKTLREEIDSYTRQGDRMPRPRILTIVRTLCDALSYAHERGMVHRDVKPGNVILDENGRPILTDFGIARMVQSARLTQDSLATGTPAYMSPEQVQGEGGDQRSDLYALGCMLFEMITGRPPYSDEGGLTLALKHISAPIPTVSETLSTSEPVLDSIILRALAKDPNDRFQSAADFTTALRLVPQEQGDDTTVLLNSKVIKSSTNASRAGAAVPAPSQSRVGWLRWLAAALLALVAVGALLVMQQSPSTSTNAPLDEQASDEVATPEMPLNETGFAVDFSQADSEYAPFPTGNDGPVERALTPDGTYRITNNLRDAAVTTLASSELPYGNVTITLQGTLTTEGDNPGAAAYGIVFRYENEDNYNVFAVDGLGRYSIWVRQAGNWRELRGEDENWTPDDAIQPVGERNTLRISVIDSVLTGSVNNQEIVRIKDVTLEYGAIGIYLAAPEDASVTVTVDSFEVYPLVPAMTDH